MKSLRFNFCHPIKGIASLTQLSLPIPMSQNIVFDSHEGNVVEIRSAYARPGNGRSY